MKPRHIYQERQFYTEEEVADIKTFVADCLRHPQKRQQFFSVLKEETDVAIEEQKENQ